MSFASLTRSQRQDLLSRDAAIRARLLDAYGLIWDRVGNRLEQLRGVDTRAAAYEQLRLLQAAEQIQSEVRGFARTVGSEMADLDFPIVQKAVNDAKELIENDYDPAPEGWSFDFKLPTAQIADLSEKFKDGEKLAKLIEQAAPYAAREVRGALIAGVALGQNPREVARNMNRVGQIPVQRATLIARTEMMRLYRETSLAVYKGNKELVKGWTWLSALDRRTCPLCWSMHGTQHKLDEQMDSHPACRCTMVPITRSWDELKVDPPPGGGKVPGYAKVLMGEAAFLGLAVVAQRAVLGPARHSLWMKGKFRFIDQVTKPASHRFLGPLRRTKNIEDTLRSAQLRKMGTPEVTFSPFQPMPSLVKVGIDPYNQPLWLDLDARRAARAVDLEALKVPAALRFPMGTLEIPIPKRVLEAKVHTFSPMTDSEWKGTGARISDSEIDRVLRDWTAWPSEDDASVARHIGRGLFEGGNHPSTTWGLFDSTTGEPLAFISSRRVMYDIDKEVVEVDFMASRHPGAGLMLANHVVEATGSTQLQWGALPGAVKFYERFLHASGHLKYTLLSEDKPKLLSDIKLVEKENLRGQTIGDLRLKKLLRPWEKFLKDRGLMPPIGFKVELADDLGDRLGEYDSATGLMRITREASRTKTPPGVTLDGVFLHELAHHVDYSSDLPDSPPGMSAILTSRHPSIVAWREAVVDSPHYRSWKETGLDLSAHEVWAVEFSHYMAEVRYGYDRHWTNLGSLGRSRLQWRGSQGSNVEDVLKALGYNDIPLRSIPDHLGDPVEWIASIPGIERELFWEGFIFDELRADSASVMRPHPRPARDDLLDAYTTFRAIYHRLPEARTREFLELLTHNNGLATAFIERMYDEFED